MKNAGWYLDEITVVIRDLADIEAPTSLIVKIEELADRICLTDRMGGEVLITGNGGSWCLAEHFALDLRKTAAPEGCPGIRARALLGGAMATAIANDVGWERVFADQLRGHGFRDLVIAISVSGISHNILILLKEAQDLSIGRYLLTGSEISAGGGTETTRIAVPSMDPLVVEPIHSAICHCVTAAVRRRLAPPKRVSHANAI